MGYEQALAGSPILPVRFAAFYGIGIFTLLSAAILIRKKGLRISLAHTILIFHLTLGTLLLTGSFVLFTRESGIAGAKFVNKDNGMGVIEITFNRPVKRGDLIKSISPYVPGKWIFEDPIYDTHLYLKLVFYPHFRLAPLREYTVNLSGVRNFLNRTENSYTLTIAPSDNFNVLGDSSTGTKFMVIGSFPENGWEGINIDTDIRVRFSHPVDKAQAEENFSLKPAVQGKFSWDGETMVFSPDTDLFYLTEYEIREKQGVKIADGSFLTGEYKASFKTQPEITRLPVPQYLQKYSLSCEIAALRMVLAYRDINVSEDDPLAKVGFDPNGKSGNTWGNPYVGFVGSVRGRQMVTGYGVYWDPIARTANNYRYAKSFENGTVRMITESIQKGIPVIVWISINGRTPSVWTTPGGDTIKVVPDEHAVVVTGYTGSPKNPIEIIVNDPLTGESFWSRESFEKKWDSLGRSGVVVY